MILGRVRLFLILFSICFLGGSKTFEYEVILPEILVIIVSEKEPEEVLNIPPRRNVPEEYRSIFSGAAASTGIPPGVLESVAFVESEFKATAKSPVRESGHRDLGIFQFNSRYIDWYAEKYNQGKAFDPFNPEEAITVAALHMVFLFERYGNWEDAVLAYNAGYPTVDSGQIPASSYQYLAKVFEKQEGINWKVQQ
jgi:soluble lytic murein transglycosylase-like protein